MPPLLKLLPNALVDVEAHLINLTRKLLNAITQGDWNTYVELTSADMTCFEPEAGTHLVQGQDFHRFYFPTDSQYVSPKSANSQLHDSCSILNDRNLKSPTPKSDELTTTATLRPAQKNTTLVHPKVRFLDKNKNSAALVTYVRLTQYSRQDGSLVTSEVSESRIWVCDETDREKWRNVHFHRSTSKL